MKMIKVSFLIFTIIYCAGFGFSQSIPPSPREQLLTVKKYYLPREDDPFFKRGNDIEVLDDIIFVLENINHHILTYSINSKDELIFKGFLAIPYFDPGLSSEIQEICERLQKNGIKREKNGSIALIAPNFFKDVYLCNDKIYILNSRRESLINPHIKIRVLDKNSLELLTTLLIKKNSDEEWIQSFAIKEVNKKAIIFAAMETEEGTVIAKFEE